MRFSLAVLIAIVLASPVSASLQIVSIHQTGTPGDLLDPVNIPPFPVNDFSAKLITDLGLAKVVVGNVMVSGPGTLTFFAHASESGFTNTFSVGPLTYTETSDVNPWNLAGIPITSLDTLTTSIHVAGPTLLSAVGLDAKFTTSQPFPGGINASITQGGFGIFAKTNLDGSIFTGDYNELYFGYDDNGAGPDDNHDDLIVRVKFVPDPPSGGNSPVPEPISFVVWGALVGATILVPAASRRR